MPGAREASVGTIWRIRRYPLFSAIMSRALVTVMLAALTCAAEAKMLAPGDPFPTWELPTHTGARASSRELAGKTYLVWFYPKAQTKGCTTEGLGLKREYPAFQQRGVDIFGVSFDEPKANAEFVDVQGFPFRLLSDADRRLAVAVGAADSPSQAVAARISYLVGPDGRVLKAYPNVDPEKHAGQVLADLPQR
jgi:peroxiredoxin Q/BCP